MKFNFLTVCEIFFKLKFSKFIQDIRTQESFVKFLLIVQEFSPQLRSHYNLGAIGGELSAELPFILMHPKPNMKKIMKADTMNDNTDYKAQYIHYTVDPIELLCSIKAVAQISELFTSNE